MSAKFKLKPLHISLYIVFIFALMPDIKLNAKDLLYKLESHFSTSINKIAIPNNMEYMTYTLEGSWTDNYGNLGLIKCTGETQVDKIKKVEIFGVCEIIDEDKDKKWWTLKREKSELDLGVGKSKQIAGDNIWNVLNGIECNYAIKHAEGFSYMKVNCNINNLQHNSLLQK